MQERVFLKRDKQSGEKALEAEITYPNVPVYGFKGNPPPTGMLAPVT
jgi:hypothetical protein